MPLYPNTPTRKDPDSVGQYDMDCGPWLSSIGDGAAELAGVQVDIFLVDQVTVPPSGIGDSPLVAVGVPAVSAGDGSVVRYVILRLSGGEAGVIYAVRHRITTTVGDIEDVTRFVRVKNR